MVINMRLFLKIIGFAMIGFLIIALVLNFAGVEEVTFDDRYYSFMLDVNNKLSEWSNIKIPSIPKVSIGNNGLVDLNGDGFSIDFRGFQSFLNNILFSFLNMLIGLVNTMFEVLKFFTAMVVILFEDVPKFLSSTDSSSSSEAINSIPRMMFPIL